MGLQLVTAPSVEPVTLTEVKLHLRVDISDDNTLISAMITAAREYVEQYLRRVLVTQVWDYYLDVFPAGSALKLPQPPLQSVGSVTYTDADEAATTFNSSNYLVDAVSVPGWIVLKSGVAWPGDTLRAANGVVIRFTAGYGLAADVPQAIKQALMLLIGDMYENRENTIIAQGVSVMRLPFSAEALLYPYRVVTF